MASVRTAPDASRHKYDALDRKNASYHIGLMIDALLAGPGKWDRDTLPPSVRTLLFGFGYWLFFLLALEPGNILATSGQLDAGQECLRILGASVLGASVTPLLLSLGRRFPLREDRTWRNAALQFGGSLAVSAFLIGASCLLANWFLASEHRPLAQALREEFEGNWPLVVFGVTGIIALVNTRLFQTEAENSNSQKPNNGRCGQTSFLTQFTVTERGCLVCVPVADVDWIEAQGNYLALHCGAKTHLLRASLGAMEKRLDPAQFARIHRGAIVAITRVRRIMSMGAGDGTLHLVDGTELRLSRTYRRTFVAAANPAQSA